MSSNYLLNTYARYPITLVKGKGKFVWDSKNKKYLDFLSSLGCTPLGHCHPAIEKDTLKQFKKLLHTSNLYSSLPSIKLAKFLINHGGLDKIFFCNSGTEANEAAIKFSRKYQYQKKLKNKNIILSASHSFHGRTLGALTATAKKKIQIGFGPLPRGFKYQSWKNTKFFCDAIDENVAAVILEPIQGEGGIHVAKKSFLKAVRKKCNKMGALLIFDEVQCGLGRTGELFAYQSFGVKPDIITLAKGIANGLPLGAVCVNNLVARTIQPGDHGSTFGGNAISCAAALSTLNIIIKKKYLSKIKKLSFYLKQKLHLLQKKHPDDIKEIRGMGLMIGIEFKIDPKPILFFCQRSRLLANIVAENTLRLLPPYIIKKSDIDFAIRILEKSLQIGHVPQ